MSVIYRTSIPARQAIFSARVAVPTLRTFTTSQRLPFASTSSALVHSSTSPGSSVAASPVHAGVRQAGSATPSFDGVSSPNRSPSELRDPLAALNPRTLATATGHLQQAALIDLVRQYVVYLASGSPALVSSGPWMLKQLDWARQNVPVLGELIWSIFAVGMKATFFKVYAGGETVAECEAIYKELAANDVGCLLNYSAEAVDDAAGAGQTGVVQAAMDEAVHAVKGSARYGDSPDALATTALKPSIFAIKVTGLLYEPSLLSRATTALVNSSAWQKGEDLPAGVLFPNSAELTEADHAALGDLYAGLREVGAAARDNGLRLLVDAEQSWFQPAIDRLTDLLSEEFNKVLPGAQGPSIPIVHNTYQTYLRTAPGVMAGAIARAERLGYSFGAKVVRGAYVEAERKRHVNLGLPGDCVVWNTKQETDDCYDGCAKQLEGRIAKELKEAKAGPGTGAFFASHNGTSMRKVLDALRADGLAKTVDGRGVEVDERVRGRVSFGQLQGMSDNLTSTLVTILAPSASAAQPAIPFIFKYLPYASFDQAIPYLIRRANENQSILQGDATSGRGGAKDERRAVGKMIRSRVGIPF